MTEGRHRDGSPPWRFTGTCLVMCPRCEDAATIVWRGIDTRLVCAACGLVREWDGRIHALGPSGELRVYSHSHHGLGWLDEETKQRAARGSLLIPGTADPFNGSADGHDPYFGFPLWLRADCCDGHTLWAYNRDHLDFLEAFIAAKIRERPRYRTLTWRLPKWMKDAKHRDELLRHIQRLRSTLETTH